MSKTKLKPQEKEPDVFSFITTEESNYKTVRVPLTDSKDWNMHEHIERCTNVANAWFHSGKNDGNRPYKDIVTPILNVAMRSEGFDVKDIVPFVNDSDNYYKSFLIKKFHPQWARKNELDTFIDELVESSIVYDLALIKNVNNVRPVVIPLQQIAFCDQTDVLSGPLCLRHQYSIPDMLAYRGKWNKDELDMSIAMAKSGKTVASASGQEVKTPGKYIEVYELHGTFPKQWLYDDTDSEYVTADDYIPQLHIVTYYTAANGKKTGLCLYKGIEKKSIFRALKIDGLKSFGRACGRSLIESLFEDQVWTNYDAIKIKKMLDSALNLFQTDSEELGNQKLSELKDNTILFHETGKPVTKVDTSLQNLPAFTNHQQGLENNARIIGSASEPQLGVSPSSGTPFKLQDLVVGEGQGIHEYRQGKIATFVADVLYRDWILDYLVREMNGGKKFSEELTMDELQDMAEKITSNVIERRIKSQILTTGNVPTNEDRDMMKTVFKEDWMKKGNRRFFEILQGELDKLPIDVFVNISGKQKYMARNADKITNIIREVIRNPQAFTQIPGIGKAFNQLIEEVGMNPIDFSQIISDVKTMQPDKATLSPIQPAEVAVDANK